MARDFMLLMVGLVFALVSIHVNRFDLLPDFVGYGLIAFASHGLAQYSARFRIARNLALPLIFLSLFYFVPWGVGSVVVLVSAILTILLVWFVLGAVIRFTSDRARPDLAEHGILYRRIYVGIAIFTFFIEWAAMAQPEAVTGFVAMAALATVIILAFILRLLYVVRHDIAADAATV